MAPLLYKMDDSPPSNTVRMLAHIIGLELDFKDVDYTNMEHKSPEYLKVNPMGRVPALVDGDFAIADSHVIMKYLLSVYGGDKKEILYPSDVRTQALVDQAMLFDVGVLFRKITMSMPTDEKRKDLETDYQVLESWLQNRKYIAADHLTIADLALGSTVASVQIVHKIDPTKFPRATEWYARLEQEDFFKLIMIPGTILLEKFLKPLWESSVQK